MHVISDLQPDNQSSNQWRFHPRRRIRKSQLVRSKNKLADNQNKLSVLETQTQLLLSEKREIEEQLEGIRCLLGEQKHLEACYNWVGRRMKIDYDLEELDKKKNKLCLLYTSPSPRD